MLLLLIAIFMAILNLVILNLTFLSAQARLIFPALAGICILITEGINLIIGYLAKISKIIKVQLIIFSFISLLIGLDLYILRWIIYPVYR